MPQSTDTTIISLERVFGPFEPHHGFASAALDDAERRLGRTLPRALRLLYERTGRHPFHTAENRLVAPDELAFDGDHLVIYEENQDVCSWAIAASALVHDDPPVDASAMTDHGIDYVPEFRSVSDFLAAQAAQQAVATLPWSGLILEPHEIAGRGTIEPRRRVSLEDAAVIGEILWTSEHTDVRIRDGAISMISSSGYFTLAARDEAVFRSVANSLRLLDDDWDYFAPRDA